MNILIVGSGKGSWEMRGVQIGAALGARAVTIPTNSDLEWADVVVLVKKAGAQWCRLVQATGKPIVWDALDCWGQPGQNQITEAAARSWLQAQLDFIRPALFVGATDAMAEAGRGLYLPHHSWSGLVSTPAREAVSVVAYEGNALYLGTWKARLDAACAARGWRFVVNPPDLSAVDIIVALRDGPWDGWICREWKSGVKLVNAMAAGRPVISQPSAAFKELSPAGCMISTPVGLDVALDRWAPVEARTEAVHQPRAAALTLDQVAARYRLILQEKRARCAV